MSLPGFFSGLSPDFDSLPIFPLWNYNLPEVKTRRFPYRVIDTFSLEFNDNLKNYGRKGGYTILSHTWIYKEEGGEFSPVEITYKEAKIRFGEQKKEMQEMAKTLEMGKKLPRNIDPGTSKLLNAIHAAKKMGHRFLWIDTCCLNKEDRAEEGISIPSMGNWYMNADICLVFLDDLALSKQDVSRLHLPTVDWTRPMQPPRWATRGWTLQEIILSQRAVFFNRNWEQVFDFDRKKSPSLQLETARILYKLCWVPEVLICNGTKPDVPSGVILNLAFIRETKLPEDRVYSLMGLFGIKLRPVYGEGFQNALEKLRHEVYHKTGDIEVFNNIIEEESKSSESGISKEFYVYPIDRLVFPRQAWDEYVKIKQSPSVGKKPKLHWFMRVNCQLVWNHGTKINLDINCRMQSLLFVLGGKTEWVFLRSKEDSSGSNEWQLAEIAQEKHSDIEDGTFKIFATRIRFSPYPPGFLDGSEFRMTGRSVYLIFDNDDDFGFKFLHLIVNEMGDLVSPAILSLARLLIWVIRLLLRRRHKWDAKRPFRIICIRCLMPTLVDFFSFFSK